MKDWYDDFKEWAKMMLGGTLWFIFTYAVIAVATLLCIAGLLALVVFGLYAFGII